MGRRRLANACLALTFVGLAGVTLRFAAAWRDQARRDQVRRDVASGRYAAARPWLAAASSRSPDDAELAFLWGLCEQAEGHPEAALAAWSRVNRPSPFAARAARARGRLRADQGRFAEAETDFLAAIEATGREAVEARYQLSQLFFWEGRADDQRRLLRDGWARSPDRAGDLRDLWLADTATLLVESIRAAVDRAARLAPDDDRVWLAQAHLATLAGRYAEAFERLEACTHRRPGDPAVWRARLRWAQAAERPDEAALALRYLPADRFEPADIAGLRAWFAGKRGDRGSERAALEDVLETAPGDARALDRLAVLESEAGDAARAAELRALKAEVDRATDRYGRLLGTSGPIHGYPELAALAETLGRWFEARGWCLLALPSQPDDPALRAELARVEARLQAAAPRPGPMLSELLADIAPRPTPAAKRDDAAIVPQYRDDAAAAGLRFVFDNGRSPQRQLPETSSGGVALLDYDGDGWLDVYLPQGGPFPPDAKRPPPGDRLFRNRGDGTFEDATARSGVDRLARGYGHGVAVGDYDNDGRPDLFLTRWRSYLLLRNQGDKTFEDATERAGLGGDRDWPTSAAWADLDGDGDLDLYVCHYLVWDEAHPRLCPADSSASGPSDASQPLGYCTPNQFPALPDHLFRNDGGRFTDVSDEAGITAADRNGRGFGVVAADLDGDGRTDLYVANDTTANYLFLNRGGLRFEETGLAAGAASNSGGGFQAGMGTACGDLDGDGRPDLFVTNFYGESTSYFRNLGGGLFQEQTAAVGLAAPSRYRLGFGIVTLDANNDGRLDLMTANGHVNDERPRFPFAMPAQLLVGAPGGRLSDVSATAGPPWQVARVGRGLASGDLDNDGREDAVLIAQNGPLAYFHNTTPGGHFATFRLEGRTSNRDGVGARVTVVAGGRKQEAQRVGGGSFQSASDGRLHFGLGGAGRFESVEVRWPSGRVDVHRDVKADTGYLLKEGAERLEPLSGFGRR